MQLLNVSLKVLALVLFITLTIQHFFYHTEPTTYDIILFMWLLFAISYKEGKDE
jgi:hypothetical protein